MSTGVVLRRAGPSDAEAYCRIMGDAQVFGGLMQLPYPDVEAWRRRLGEMSGDAGRADLALVAELQGAVVGSAGLHGSPMVRRRHAMTLGISVARDWQGRGVGCALMHALCEYADRWAQVLRLELTVFVDNAPAIALYRKFGFEVEGTLRGYALRDGVFADALTMARWHPAPPVRG